MNRRGFLSLFAAAAIAPAVPKIPAPLVRPATAGNGLRMYGGPTLPPLHPNCRCVMTVRTL